MPLLLSLLSSLTQCRSGRYSWPIKHTILILSGSLVHSSCLILFWMGGLLTTGAEDAIITPTLNRKWSGAQRRHVSELWPQYKQNVLKSYWRRGTKNGYGKSQSWQLCVFGPDNRSHCYTGLLKMTVGVLTTCHTQYTWDSSICIFLFNRTTLQVFRTYLTGAL